MPLNLSNRDQNSGHLFYNRRLRAAITRFSVRMKHDDRKQQAAVALSMVFVLIGVGWMALLHFLKPAGLVGQSAIVGDRESGQLYAKLDGRLYPALNLTSARLAVGSHATVSWVTVGEIAKFPTGPMIGIPGAPDRLEVALPAVSAWSVCDTAAVRGGAAGPVVTAIGGRLAGAATLLDDDRAVLVSRRGVTYVVWSGHRSRVDLAQRAVTFNLGLDPGAITPIEISTALFDAMPATEPLTVPDIPEKGAPSAWLPGAKVGSVLQTRDAAGAVSGFYVLLPDGVQRISGFTANLLRTADSQGATAPAPVAPDKLVDIPVVDVLDVDYYPAGKLDFVDPAANPVTCVTWEKRSGAPLATIGIVSGPNLPLPEGTESRLVRLVRDDRGPDSVEADQTLMLPGAANFIASTGGAATADSREALYWISAQGVRYGIQPDQPTLQALALDPQSARQAPWPLVRTFAPGPAISRDAALVERDQITGSVAAVPDAGRPASGG